jgi:hypothetical protein
LRKNLHQITISQKKKKEKKTPPTFSKHPIPHHQKNNSLKNQNKSHLLALKNNQTFPSHATQEINLLG